MREVNKLTNSLDKCKRTATQGWTSTEPQQFIDNFAKNLSFNEIREQIKQFKSTLKDMGNNNGVQKVDDYMKKLYSSIVYDSNEIKKLRNNIKECFGTKELENFDKTLKNIGNTTKNTKITTPIKNNNFGKSLKTALGIGTVALGIRKAVGFFNEANNEAIDYAETVNLFNVAMGKKTDQYGNLDKEASKYYIKAIAFQEKLSEKLGINIEESMKYQALFNSMAKSMSISDKYASMMSENLTKLGYDISSLYNINPEEAMRKLKAGLAGETEPLRAIGLDVTEQTIKQELDRLGIDRSVRNMSQAEKSILRYISVLRQASLAHGDFAKTMDSPANQLRIFNAQLTAFKRNMGSLWQGLLGNILPYVNAIMMVINELLKMVAKLFGFEVWEQDVSISAGVGADDLANDLGTANKKAKELKNQLMGFDEINNITLPDKSSGGSGGASVGGIDQRLLDAMKEYDNLMDKVKSKATEIRDKMMEWLGFERKGDGWQLKEGLTNAEKILDVMKTIGIAIGTWKVSNAITTLFEKLGVMEKADAFKMSFGITLAITGIFAQYKGTQHLLNGDVDIFTLLETLLGTAGGTWGIVNILKATKFGKTLSLKQQLQIGLGVMLSIQGLQVAIAGISEEDITKQIFGAIESGFGGFLIGNSIGGWKLGLAVGLGITATVFIAELASINDETAKTIKKIKEVTNETNSYAQSLQDTRNAIQENVNSQLAEIGYIEKLVGELDTLVDENGEVKDCYEGRVSFILQELSNATGEEWKLVDGTIEKYGDLKKSINEVIAKKRAEIILNANEEIYTNAIKGQLELYKQKEKQQQNVNDAQETYNGLLEKYKDLLIGDTGLTGSVTIDKEITDARLALEEASASLSDITDQWEQNTNDIIGFEHLQTAVVKDDSKEIENAIAELTNRYSDEGKQVQATLGEQIKMQADYVKTAKEQFSKAGKEINEETKKQLERGLQTLADNLVKQTAKIEELAPDQIEAWKQLADGSEKIYNEKIKDVNEDTKLVLETILNKIDTSSPDYINKWAKMANEGSKKYNNALSKLPEETKAKILASTIAVTGMTESTKTAYNSLSEEGKKAFNTAMASLDTDARNKVQSAIDEINGKKTAFKTAGEEVASEALSGAKQKVNDKNSGASKIGSWFVSGLLGSIKGGYDGAFLAGFNLVKRALAGGNEAQKTGSPAKETIKMGNFFTEGYIIGLKKQQEQVKKVSSNLVGTALKELNRFDNVGFTINPNDFKIDTNQFIDYSQISGAISTQSNVNVSSDIEGRIENAIYRGLSNATIPVEIEATTDEGVIFKKVQTKAREFSMQTGESAFEF